LVDTLGTSRSQLLPVQPGAGVIYTTNAYLWANDSTDTIVVQTGGAARIAIRTQPNNGGIELDTLTRAAGDSITLYAAFYDLQDNYLNDQPAIWSVQGDSIGYFSTAGAIDSNTFNFTVVKSANFRIQSGSLIDNSGLVKVTAGLPDSILIVSTNPQTGEASGFVLDDPEVKVIDAFNNPVPDTLVQWFTPTNGSLTPPASLTNSLGLASSSWRLKSTLGPDTAFATVIGLADTAIFTANVLSASADSMLAVSGNDTGAVSQAVANVVVQVVDTLSNPYNKFCC
jgi:hypothetical protein